MNFAYSPFHLFTFLNITAFNWFVKSVAVCMLLVSQFSGTDVAWYYNYIFNRENLW